MEKKTKLAIGVLVALIALTVVSLAVGGSDDGEAASEPASSTTAVAQTTTTVKRRETPTQSSTTTSTAAEPDPCDVEGNVDPDCHPEAEIAPYEEVGLGKCFPGDEILSRLRGQEGTHDFVEPWSYEELVILKGEQIAWMESNPDSLCLSGLAEFLDQHEYYEVNSILLERWNRLNPDDQRTEWVFDLSVAQLADYYRENVLSPVPEGGVAVMNHYYDHDDPSKVVYWKDQVLPEGELVWWLKGHSPGDGKGPIDLKPITKFVCGNPLLPPGTQPPPEEPPGEPPTEEPPCDCPPEEPPEEPPCDCPPEEPPEEEPCPTPPVGVPEEHWDPVKCKKIPQTEDQQQNNNRPARQDPQDNRTAEENGVNTGPTPGAPVEEPPQQPARPVDNAGTNQPAPDPTLNGSNSGSPDPGTGTPVGSETEPDGSTETGSVPSNNPEDTGQGGDDNQGMPPLLTPP